jgi:hypothetical protein
VAAAPKVLIAGGGIGGLVAVPVMRERTEWLYTYDVTKVPI